MLNKKLFILFFLSFSIACTPDNKRKELKQVKVSLEDQSNSITKEELSLREVNQVGGEIYPVHFSKDINGEGVVVVDLEATKEIIQIKNSDGSIYASINYKDQHLKLKEHTYNLFDIPLETYKDLFNPRLFYPENRILHFECTKENKSSYKVIVNSKEEKILDKSSFGVEFYKWEDYLSLAYISFNPQKNPLRLSPSEKAEVVYEYNDYFFKVLKVEGDWIKIKCDNDCKTCDKGSLEGWIKWKNGKKLLVYLGFIC